MTSVLKKSTLNNEYSQVDHLNISTRVLCIFDPPPSIWYLIIGVWCVSPALYLTSDIWYLMFGIRHPHLIFSIWCLVHITSTWYLMFSTYHLYLIFDIWQKQTNAGYAPLSRHWAPSTRYEAMRRKNEKLRKNEAMRRKNEGLRKKWGDEEKNEEMRKNEAMRRKNKELRNNGAMRRKRRDE